MSWMVWKSRPIYSSNFRMTLQKFGYLSTVYTMAFHAQVQCFKSPKNKEAVHGSRHCTTGIMDECKLLVKLVIIHTKCTHHNIRMSAQIFCHGMHDNVNTKLKRVLQVRRGKSVINYMKQIILLSNFRTRSNINNFHQRV